MSSGNQKYKYLALALTLTLCTGLIIYRAYQGTRSFATPKSDGVFIRDPGDPAPADPPPKKVHTTQPATAPAPTTAPATKPVFMGGSKSAMVAGPQDIAPKPPPPAPKSPEKPTTQSKQLIWGGKSAPTIQPTDIQPSQGKPSSAPPATQPSTQPGTQHDTNSAPFGYTSAGF